MRDTWRITYTTPGGPSRAVLISTTTRTRAHAVFHDLLDRWYERPDKVEILCFERFSPLITIPTSRRLVWG